MAKMTLIELVQNILGAMDSDEVNSITDTPESLQVADVIKETYYDLITNKQIPEHMELFQMTGLADSARPNYLQYPNSVASIFEIRYNTIESGETEKNYSVIPYYQPQDFLNLTNTRDSTDSGVTIVSDSSGVELLIRNDTAPQRWTSFDDSLVIFDSYDSAVDSTLQGSKTQCWGVVEPSWTHSDSFTPDIDSNYFPLLLSESKSVCFMNFKQTPNAKEEQRSKRQQVRLQRDKWNYKYQNTGPDYGR